MKRSRATPHLSRALQSARRRACRRGTTLALVADVDALRELARIVRRIELRRTGSYRGGPLVLVAADEREGQCDDQHTHELGPLALLIVPTRSEALRGSDNSGACSRSALGTKAALDRFHCLIAEVTAEPSSSSEELAVIGWRPGIECMMAAFWHGANHGLLASSS